MNNNNSWLTQKQIDHVEAVRGNRAHFKTETMYRIFGDEHELERKPVLLQVQGPQRNYWLLVFWSAWGAGIVLLIAWLVL